MATSYLGQANLPRGLRNNNPGNLKVSADTWLGQVGDDGVFVRFSDLAWGVRAMGTVAAHDINRGLDTIRKYISSYAPASENATDVYIAKVAAYTGLKPDQPIPKTLPALKALLKAQMTVELGAQYARMIPDADINQGLKLMNSSILSVFKDVGGSALGLVAVGIIIWLWLRK